ncbi:Fic family protein [Zhihengliuella salsuginis]|uniref:Fido domain-containing protein n=1 Tax=Zhihengliuella salsuginis TaxID=578222 RepID=A0ABQ3GHJ3_9MICC|nr:Fic family protein [Zhihengliuella salsuginis]GHD05936.1 hypothetical protein GCM10008096_15340 [Zhihengliuella salsuginis]
MDALTVDARAILTGTASKASVFDLEQAVQDDIAAEQLTAVLAGELDVDELLTDTYVRGLHRRMYGDIWTWAGVYRKRELNIGVAPEQIATQLHAALANLLYRWHHTDDWDPRILGIAVHAETVRIHPFVDGNGRSTRLLADLVFAAAQGTETVEVYDWVLEKRHYIELLRAYDRHRDPIDLADFIRTIPVTD